VSEICRHRPVECAAALAQWQVDDPASPSLAAVLASVRSNPVVSRHLQREKFQRLLQLFGREAERSEPIGVDAALATTDAFERYYTHLAPFSRDALAQTWRRCRDGLGPSERTCRAGRRAAERKVGPLEAAPAAETARRAG
jgi:hypothetical protein